MIMEDFKTGTFDRDSYAVYKDFFISFLKGHSFHSHLYEWVHLLLFSLTLFEWIK